MKRIVRRGYFVAVAVIMACLASAMPILAQQDDLVAGRIAGEEAARADVNQQLWFGVGCVGGILGCAFAYFYAPSPPSAQLLGKSPEYITGYIDAYKATARTVQTHSALKGFIVPVVVGCAAYVLLVIVAAGSAATTYY
jgi:hypothetical protein